MKFKLIDNLKFVNVDMDFLRKLHDVSSEVYYKESDYENKPYLGILLSSNNYKYFIPLSSAKEKHKKWKLVGTDRFLVYRIKKRLDIRKDEIWIDSPLSKEDIIHIFSAIDIKKMIPIVDSAIRIVNINFDKNDTLEEKFYKDLLQNEYNFCVNIIDKIIAKAEKVYDKQTTTKYGLKFCCDFKALEKVVDNYEKP